jgi:hypothetical protein
MLKKGTPGESRKPFDASDQPGSPIARVGNEAHDGGASAQLGRQAARSAALMA